MCCFEVGCHSTKLLAGMSSLRSQHLILLPLPVPPSYLMRHARRQSATVIHSIMPRNHTPSCSYLQCRIHGPQGFSAPHALSNLHKGFVALKLCNPCGSLLCLCVGAFHCALHTDTMYVLYPPPPPLSNPFSLPSSGTWVPN